MRFLQPFWFALGFFSLWSFSPCRDAGAPAPSPAFFGEVLVAVLAVVRRALANLFLLQQ